MTIEFDAVYYDGRRSARFEVRVRADDDQLHVHGPSFNVAVPRGAIGAEAPIAGARRVLRLPDGGQLQTDDHAAIDALFPRAERLERLVHALERRWPYAAGALAVVVVFAWWAVVYGLPVAANSVAASIPAGLESKIGEQTLAVLDARMCRPSTMPPATQETLRRRFGALTRGLDDRYRYQLELRSCQGIGPNAFALPGGVIVLTDQLLVLAQDYPQVDAVLAHEIGHVQMRHGLRTALQGAGLAALITALAGDAAAISSLAVVLPTVLLQSSYSREFEGEADSFALARLKATGISPQAFAEILTRIEASRKDRRGDGAHDYFSTHPVTAERIERALEALSDADRCAANAGADEARIDACTRVIVAGQAPADKLAESYHYRASAWDRKGAPERASADYSDALRLNPRGPGTLNALAWLLATSTSEGARDGKRAVELAIQACELTAWKNPILLDTLAAAYAETGRFDEAVRWQNKALEFPEFKKSEIKAGRERLSLYESGRPYREAKRR